MRTKSVREGCNLQLGNLVLTLLPQSSILLLATKSRAKSGGEPRRNLLEAKNELSSTEFVRGQAVRALDDDGDAHKMAAATFDCTEGNSILQGF
jgi:hypothetical protein